MGRKVFVIMRNDFPNAVVSSKDKAEDYVEAHTIVDRALAKGYPRIYWRWYEFELDKLGGRKS